MNILIPDSWLREHLKTKATPEQIAEALSLHSAPVEEIEKVGNDYVYNIELTTNRIDMVSIIGIAREAAAALLRSGTKAEVASLTLPKPVTPTKSLPLTIQNDPKLCSRVMAVVLENTRLQPSPKHIQHRLEAAGVRTLNNIVDITNYVMLEIGHPTHAFDYERIKTHKLIIRPAKKGEKIVSLENKAYRLPGGDSIIEDGTGEIIDLPGIIGTENSVVTNATERVLFFIENNDPHQMRRSSMALDIRTLAATINEKGPDPELAETALYRGIELYQKFAQAKIASKIFDIYPGKRKPKNIQLDYGLVEKILGVKISSSQIQNMLESLGFHTTHLTPHTSLSITVPSWRSDDISLAEDLIEEIARMYGYHNIPSHLPPFTQPPQPVDTTPFSWQETIKNVLQNRGFNEIYSYSLISQELLENVGLDVKGALKLVNPLTQEGEFLRPSLIPSLLEAVANNQDKKERLDFFELANIYLPTRAKSRLPNEKLRLALVSTNTNPLKLKETVEALFINLAIPDYEFVNKIKENSPMLKVLQTDRRAEIKIKTKAAGFIGQLDHNTTERFGIKKELSIVEVDFGILTEHARKFKEYHPIGDYPPLLEDMTFALPARTSLGPIIATIMQQSRLIKDVQLHDEFKNNVTFRIAYQSKQKSLSTKDVKAIRKRVGERVEKKFNAKLKSK